MLPPINPNLLVTLTILLRTRSVSGTAVTLGLSQPSVSRALAELRTALKDPLLVRAGNAMVRTRRGEELSGRLEEWLATTNSVLSEAEFHPARIERRFRIATTDFGVLSVIVPALEAIQREAPGLAIDLVPLNHAVHTGLAGGTLDLAISGLDHDPSLMHSRLLYTDGFACLMRKGHPLAGEGQGALPLDQFMAYPHISLTVSDAELDRVTLALGEAARGRRIAASLPYFAMAPELIGGSDAVMMLPEKAARHYGRLHHLSWRPAPVEIGRLKYWLLWHERSQRDPASAWLREKLGEAGHSPSE